jgi:hypothetical protein
MTFSSFKEFYPFYLSQHTRTSTKRLHFVGSCATLMLLAFGKVIAAIVAGYAFAWIGHFFFEKNRPATFTHPLYSLMGDWRMFWDVLRGRVEL